MQASVKIGLFLGASALAGLAQAQPGAAQTETVSGARSGSVNPPMPYNPTEATIKKSNSFAGTPLKPQANEPGKIEFPNVRAPAPAAQPYQGQPVPTYNLQNAWPKKAEPAPRPVVRQPPPAPRTPVPDPVIRRLPSVSTSR